MTSRIYVKRLYIEKFRKLKEIDIKIGTNLTLISGHNGIGKSNILSLIASGSGKKINKQIVDGNFQPEFYDFFYIDKKEVDEDYNSFLYYGYKEQTEEEGFVKRLSLKDDTREGRGIRIIPRLNNKNIPDKTIKSIAGKIKSEYGVSTDSRVPVPTIFISLSRLYPIGETDIKTKKLSIQNSFNVNKANAKYAEWYNAIIQNSINLKDSEVYEFEKTTTKKSSTYMDLESTTIKTQSIGQDNVGNIVSALIKFYLLSLKEDYSGGILCIDEIDVSLHPNVQINMLELLDRLSKELDLQIILTTHSLTLIKEIIKLKNKNSEEAYSLIYLRNSSYPMVSNYNTYESLKSDLYEDYTYIPPKIKMYFEDETTSTIFNLLLDSYNYILEEVRNNKENFYENFRSSDILTEDEKEKLTNKILSLEKVTTLRSELDLINIHLGCDNLIKLNEKDTYFNSVLITLDGDARLNPDKRPKISTYLKNNKIINSLNTKQTKFNIIFLPNFFAPESFLYMIIYEFTQNQEKYLKFWRSLNDSETFQYTRDLVMEELIYKDDNYDNESIKKNSKYIFEFTERSRIILHYYLEYENMDELLEFMGSIIKAFNIVKQKVQSNRYIVN